MSGASRTATGVVVCVYTAQRWDDIVAGLAAIAAGTLVPDDVVVVVDHDDALLAALQEHVAGAHAAGPAVRVVASTGTKGLSGARNTGIATVRGDLVAFLDDDACPEPGWLAALTAPFARRTVMAVGGRAVPVWPQRRPVWFPDEFDWVVGCSYRGLPTAQAAVRNVIGSSMAFRAEAFALVGGFVEGVGRVGTVPKGAEETELCIRLTQRAAPPVEILFEPASVVHHRVGAERVTPRYFRRRCFAEGQSKAQIGALIGHTDGTSTERSYTTRTLPAGVVRALAGAVRGRPREASRALAIVVGLLTTTAGYAQGRVALGWRNRMSSSAEV